MFKKDDSNFKKYIESTTAHGVVRIFTGKSIIRRLFWLAIVLVAAGGCLFNISDRIRFLISDPTSTALSITRLSTLTFPAVTVCNLNNFRADVLEERKVIDVIQTVLDFGDPTDNIVGIEGCNTVVQNVSKSEFVNLSSLQYEELTNEARYPLEDFILECFFAGRQCNVTEVFEPIFTNLGVCYTFNSGRLGKPLLASGTGQRQGLQLYIDVNQLSYTTPIDAGVKVAIHPQSEPPLPDDQGIGVPTGRNAFIGLKEQNFRDKTERNCNPESQVSNFNFLRREYTTYSVPACLVDCIQTSMASKCRCIAARSFYSPDSSEFSQLPNCTLEHICCIVNELQSPSQCNCPAACSSISYDTTTSYSYFPADFQSVKLAEFFNITPDYFPNNILAINVYFETLNVEMQTTTNAYSFIALLSDIGGQLGLFLGVSVISIMEFGTWIIDEIKDRVFGISEKKMKDKCYACCQHHSQKETAHAESEITHNSEKELDVL